MKLAKAGDKLLQEYEKAKNHINFSTFVIPVRLRQSLSRTGDSFGDVLQWYGIFEHPPQRFVLIFYILISKTYENAHWRNLG